MKKLLIILAMVIFLVAGCSNGGDTIYYTSPGNSDEEPEKPSCYRTLNIYVNEYTGIENGNEQARAIVQLFRDFELTLPHSGSASGEKPLFTDKSALGTPDYGGSVSEPNDIWVMVFVDRNNDEFWSSPEEGDPYHPECPLYIPVGQYDCGEIIEVYFDSFDDTYLW